ncbi:Alpha/Beta hydrolase protein [Mycena maculata]|uniref:Alpha/Beta hydrolase protein n=1 Tax=Mycena maculata TaxID=230809 RepID=A0AAD7HKC9_9AGAR|nr:Alpha/Beta hydrolase protein [Mycena maculata]
MTEFPFEISIPDEKLVLLQKKLEVTRLPDELEDSGWAYGVPLEDVRRLLERWKTGYDWRKHESQLNSELPQFTRDIHVDGHGTLNIHYIHKTSEVATAIPLLFIHGWPGSFLEARKLLPLLTKPEGSVNVPKFHVVAMSIPGFGFSQSPRTKGFRLEQYAEVGNKLMLALGYDEYVTQGGDWGFPITCRIAKMYGGTYSKAWHTNMPIGDVPESTTEPALTGKEKAGLERTSWFRRASVGYLMQQSTQPQTLGYSLSDSPVGLLAWIYEKLVTWSDAYPWEDDEVLTWISIHWFSRAGPTASLRIYFEADINTAFSVPEPRPTIPLGLSHFPKDILVFPQSWTRDMGNVVFQQEHESGGHFAAYERPEYLADDLRKMFGKGGPAFGVVSGKTGYADL